jgi:hypothetical protein
MDMKWLSVIKYKHTLAYSVTQYGWCPYAVSNIETVYSANVRVTIYACYITKFTLMFVQFLFGSVNVHMSKLERQIMAST